MPPGGRIVDRMGKRRPPAPSIVPPPTPSSPDDQGLSLEELGQAYAEALASGRSPYATPEEAAPLVDPVAEDSTAPDKALRSLLIDDNNGGGHVVDQHCELSPASILEAILFVGRPDNQPITSAEIARLMRGVRANEIDELVIDLNRAFDEQKTAYFIASAGAGYRMELRPQYDRLCRKVYGKVREVRLSQAAIDCLAIVAYKQPIRREEIDRLRGKASSGPLALLVRRGLVKVERAEDARRPEYRTTQRFLELFHLEHLDDLPQSRQIEID